jgi:hypothetical protein
VPLDHRSEGFVGFEPLPLQLRAPVLEDLSRPRLAVAIPELSAKESSAHMQAIELPGFGIYRLRAERFSLISA